jgi:hypothetical protein
LQRLSGGAAEIFELAGAHTLEFEQDASAFDAALARWRARVASLPSALPT